MIRTVGIANEDDELLWVVNEPYPLPPLSESPFQPIDWKTDENYARALKRYKEDDIEGDYDLCSFEWGSVRDEYMATGEADAYEWAEFYRFHPSSGRLVVVSTGLDEEQALDYRHSPMLTKAASRLYGSIVREAAMDL